MIMEMKYIIADFLAESADKIRKNECGLQESEIIYLASQIMHVKVNKTQAAEFLHISSRTFDRKFVMENFLLVRKILVVINFTGIRMNY